jgi:dephospho-CoA kinase
MKMIKQPVKVGVTGSIGMGKTTVALEMAKFNYPVWNSDEAVHNLYGRGELGYNIIKKFIPDAAVGLYVDRDILSTKLIKFPDLIKKIEDEIHPLVNEKRECFLLEHSNKKLIIFDIPLLFETSCEEWLDCIIVVNAPLLVQKKRVLLRKGMTEKKTLLYLISSN